MAELGDTLDCQGRPLGGPVYRLSQVTPSGVGVGPRRLSSSGSGRISDAIHCRSNELVKQDSVGLPLCLSPFRNVEQTDAKPNLLLINVADAVL